MKIKVIFLSFLITTFLSLNFVIPQLVQEHLQVFLGDAQRNLAAYGLKLNFDSARMSYLPLKIRIDNLSISAADKAIESERIFSTNRVEFSNWSFSEVISVVQGEMGISDLSKLRIAVQQLEFNEKYISPKIDSALKSLGYNKLILNVVSDYQYNVASKDFLLNELSFEGFKMGKINLKFHLTDFVVPSSLDMKELAGFNESSVKFFSLEYTDDSLVKNIKSLAEKNNVPLERYLAFSNKIEGNRDPANVDEESTITLGLQKFVKDPHSMKLEVTPEKEIPFKDISLMMMLSPAKLIESLQPSLVINGSEIEISKGN